MLRSASARRPKSVKVAPAAAFQAKQVPAAPGDVGGLVQALDHAAKRVAGRFRARRRGRSAVLRQGAQMGMFCLAQAQRAGQRIDGGGGGADGASLLQPDVPVDADAGAVRRLPAGAARLSGAGGRSSRPTAFGVSFSRRDRRKSPNVRFGLAGPVHWRASWARRGRHNPG